MTAADKYSSLEQIMSAVFEVETQSLRVTDSGGGGGTLDGDVTGPSDDNTIVNQNLTTIWVNSEGGVDAATGRGGFYKPYATLSYALSQISDNAVGKQYLIKSSGVITEAALEFKPYVHHDGQNSTTLILTSAAGLAAGWSAGGQIKISNFLDIQGDMTLNAASASASATFELENLRGTTEDCTWFITAPGGHASTAIFSNIKLSSSSMLIGTLNFSLHHLVNIVEGYGTSASISLGVDAATFTLGDARYNAVGCMVTFFTIQAYGAGTPVDMTGGITGSWIVTLTQGATAGNINDCTCNDSSVYGLVLDAAEPDTVYFQSYIIPSFITYLNAASANEITPMLGNSFTTTRRLALGGGNPTRGTLIYDTDLRQYAFRAQTLWKMLGYRNLTTVYVASAAGVGSDTTGDGSPEAPYATIEHAISQITDAAAGKPYLLLCVGFFEEENLIIKPNMTICGCGVSSLSVDNQITLDASWNSLGGKFALQNFVTFQPLGGIEMNGSTYPESEFVFSNLKFDATGVWSLAGSAGATTYVKLEDISFTGDMPLLDFIDIHQCIIKNSVFDEVFLKSTLKTSSYICESITCDDLSLDATTATGVLNVSLNGVDNVGTFNVTQSSSANININQKNSQHNGAITLNGAGGVEYVFDRLVQLPTLLGGLTASSLIYRGNFAQAIKLTTTERDSLAIPEGVWIYNTTLNKMQYYDTTTWVSVP